MDHSPLSPEQELVMSDYKRYLHLWSYTRPNYRLAVARDFLHWWERPVDQPQPSHWQTYAQERPPCRRATLVSFRRFLEETGRLRRSKPLDPAEWPLPGVPEATASRVQEFLRARKRSGQGYGGRQTEHCLLKGFLQALPPERQEDLAQLTHRDVEAFIEAGQDRGLAPTTINRHLTTLRSFFAWLQAQGHYLGDNPVRLDHYLTQPDPLPRAMRREDVQALLIVLDDVMDRALFLVLLRSGIRVGEALVLTVADVDLAQATLVVRQGGKNGRGRVVYLAEDARQALEAWLAARQNIPLARLFFTWASHQLTHGTVRARFHRYLKKAGISRLYRPHDLRHTFATELLNAGVPITTLQQLMGHATISITQRYARVSEPTKRGQYFAAMHKIQRASPWLLQGDEEMTDVAAAG